MAAIGYLDPATRQRSNLAISTDTQVSQLLCAAYYRMVSELLKTRLDSAELMATNFQASRVLYERAIVIADGIGQKRETVAARFEMSVTGMRDAIGGDASNSSILLNRYGRSCKITSENVEARIEYWVGQALQEEARRPRK